MKSLMRFIASVTIISFLFGAPYHTTQAAIIGFDGIPDGTPVSEGNPYAEVLTIQARVGWEEARPDSTIIWLPGLIYNERIDTTLRERQPGYFTIRNMSEMTATFSQPVTDVSFDAWAWRHATYEYFGANASGEAFTGNGTFVVEPWDFSLDAPMVPISLTLPSGYHLTQFTVRNVDPGSGYDFRVDNIRFTIPAGPGEHSVPDEGATALLLGISCFSLAALRHRMREQLDDGLYRRSFQGRLCTGHSTQRS